MRRSLQWLRNGVLTLLTALLAASAAVAQPAPAPLAGLDAYIEAAIKDWGIAGLAVAIVKDDSVVYLRGFGVREGDRPERVDANTVFAIGSNTKLFTAVAAGMLVDAGRIGWDEPVTTYLRGFQLHDPWVTREVTLRDLLSHRTGLGEQRGNMVAFASALDRGEVLRRVRFLRPASSFRSQFAYQNLGLLAAGEAAAAAGGVSWDDLVKDRILRPLGMSATGTSVRDLAAQRNVATPHSNLDGRLAAIPWRNIDNIGPAGSINSNATDMARWVRFLLANGRASGTQLLQPATLHEIESPQSIVRCPTDSLRPSVHFCAYGLGVLMNDYLGVKVLSHTGGIDGMLSDVVLVPERRLGIVVLTNTDGHNALFVAVARQILDAYLGAPTRDWSALLLAETRQQERALHAMEAAAEARRPRNTRPSLPLAAYGGRYANQMYGELVVEPDGRQLVLRFEPTLTGDLEHWAHDTYKLTWRGAGNRDVLGPTFVTFVVDPFGKATSLRLRDDVLRLPGQGAWDADEFVRVDERAPTVAGPAGGPKP